MRFVLALCATLCLPTTAFAQTHPLVGQWTLSMPAPMRGADGQVAMITRKSVMTVALVGDSLIAMLKHEPAPGEPASGERRLAGIRGTGAVRLVNSSTAMLSGGSGSVAREATTIYLLEARGETVTGTMTIEVPGIPDIPSRAVTGMRVSR